jgi:hypothetical protein
MNRSSLAMRVIIGLTLCLVFAGIVKNKEDAADAALFFMCAGPGRFVLGSALAWLAGEPLGVGDCRGTRGFGGCRDYLRVASGVEGVVAGSIEALRYE